MLPLRTIVLAGMVLLLAVAAPAAEACKTEMLASPALSLADMYAKAEALAKAWKADAVPARLGSTLFGPLDEGGRSEAWNMLFYSAAADAHVAINTFRGTLTCWADRGSAGRIPDLAPSFLRDGAKLYAIAKQHGADLLARGYGVSVQTAAAPSDRHATWYVGYSKQDGTSGPLTVVVDANTGAVESVLRDE
jgi:hypothetical protein